MVIWGWFIKVYYCFAHSTNRMNFQSCLFTNSFNKLSRIVAVDCGTLRDVGELVVDAPAWQFP